MSLTQGAVDPLTAVPGVPEQARLEVLDEIAQRALWLAARMVDYANHDRPGDGLKVGGHQASSASVVGIFTALYMAHLDAEDQFSVKPHASPVMHALWYLMGDLDRSYLTQLRVRSGLQAYPSRTKDPVRVDYSNGSVGLGPVAPLFSAVTRRYVDAHFGPRPRSRFVAVLGDAELDEGTIWEAIGDPATQGLGEVMWVIDLNRQSLDRVVPGIRVQAWQAQFQAAGWHVVEVKYGRALRAAFEQPGGDALRAWIDGMANEQYQALFSPDPATTRALFLEGAPPEVVQFCSGLDDVALVALVTDLGGHDIASLLQAYAACDAVTDRPSVVFAYTVKGWGLPMAGNPRNHSALLSPEQLSALRTQTGLTPDTEWDRFDPASQAGQWAARRREHLRRPPREAAIAVSVPSASGARVAATASTQEAFGRVLVELSRNPALAPYLVTTAPDVATSTNLAGFINRLGVFSPDQRRAWSSDPMLKWVEAPAGQHIELGISEMNLYLLLGALGLSWDQSRQPLIPVGTVYDPFVLRGLDALIYSLYNGARFVFAGTPSGLSLAPEGGAHQSTITASVGLELPQLTFCEPTYAQALDWLLCDAVSSIAGAQTGPGAETGAYYFRLTTRSLDQAPFERARARLGEAVIRRSVLAGAYQLVDASQAAASGAPVVHLAASGAVMPEVLAAAEELLSEGVAAHVVDVTSLDRLYAAWQRTLRQGIRTATAPSVPGALRTVFTQRAPIVTVHDASSHAMAWMGSALGVPCVPVGVDGFGQSGSIADLYALHDLDSGSIVNAALAALSLR